MIYKTISVNGKLSGAKHLGKVIDNDHHEFDGEKLKLFMPGAIFHFTVEDINQILFITKRLVDESAKKERERKLAA